MVGWKLPLEGRVKYMDGACKNGHMTRCGGIIRYNPGEWSGIFVKFVGISSAFVAELREVLEERLKYTWLLGFKVVELNIDSMVNRSSNQNCNDKK
jgi:hypothetical protein